MKTFLIDVDKCTGCYSCQLGCKDEHCGNCWMPYAQEQPETGQFWMHVAEKERGAGTHILVSYLPKMCQHCYSPSCLAACDTEAINKRKDGLVLIDPAKCNGCGACVEACPYGVVYFNDELKIAQKCTGCAHLIDEGDTIKVPRCYDNCVHDAIKWGEENEFDLSGAQRLHPEYGTSPQVWYKNLPQRFIAATVYDPQEMEVIQGAAVVARSGNAAFATVTDEFGDFWLDDLPEKDWQLSISAKGKEKVIEVSTVEKDQGLVDIALK